MRKEKPENATACDAHRGFHAALFKERTRALPEKLVAHLLAREPMSRCGMHNVSAVICRNAAHAETVIVAVKRLQ
jgi:hypothetical protein